MEVKAKIAIARRQVRIKVWRTARRVDGTRSREDDFGVFSVVQSPGRKTNKAKREKEQTMEIRGPVMGKENK